MHINYQSWILLRHEFAWFYGVAPTIVLVRINTVPITKETVLHRSHNTKLENNRVVQGRPKLHPLDQGFAQTPRG